MAIATHPCREALVKSMVLAPKHRGEREREVWGQGQQSGLKISSRENCGVATVVGKELFQGFLATLLISIWADVRTAAHLTCSATVKGCVKATEMALALWMPFLCKRTLSLYIRGFQSLLHPEVRGHLGLDR